MQCFGPSKNQTVSSTVVNVAMGELRELQSKLPGSSSMLIIDPDGEVITSVDVEESVRDDIVPRIAQLKFATEALGASAGEHYIPVVHIKGLNHTIGCYEFQDYLLILWVESHGSAELFETAECDALVRPTLDNLSQVLT